MLRRKRAVAVLAFSVVSSLVGAAPAMAAAPLGAADLGQGLGSFISTFAQDLLLPVAALVGIPALARHDFGLGITIFILVLLLGGFVYDPGGITTALRTAWNGIAH